MTQSDIKATFNRELVKITEREDDQIANIVAEVANGATLEYLYYNLRDVFREEFPTQILQPSRERDGRQYAGLLACINNILRQRGEQALTVEGFLRGYNTCWY